MRLWPRRAEERTLTPPRLEQPLQPIYGPYSFPLDGTVITTASALRNPTVWACCRVLADAAAACPLRVYRRLENDGRVRIGGRTDALLQRPAEGSTQSDFVRTLVLHLVTAGNSYVGKYRDETGRIVALLPIQPDQVMVERRAGKIVFTVSQDGRTSEHGLGDLIHIKAISSDGILGLSPVQQVRSAIELDNAVRTASTALFSNGARPSGILSIHRASADQAQSIKDQWTAKHAGANQGGVAVLSGAELSFQAISMPADDAEFCEARRLSATEICRAFRVPAWMVSASDDSSMTYSNSEAQMLSFAMLSLQPWLTAIEGAISADSDLFSPNTFAEFKIDALLRADSRTRSEVYTAALNQQTGWLRRDEVRRFENLPPEEPSTVQLPVVPSTNGQGVVIA